MFLYKKKCFLLHNKIILLYNIARTGNFSMLTLGAPKDIISVSKLILIYIFVFLIRFSSNKVSVIYYDYQVNAKHSTVLTFNIIIKSICLIHSNEIRESSLILNKRIKVDYTIRTINHISLFKTINSIYTI